jgi:histidine ammonia-lyase
MANRLNLSEIEGYAINKKPFHLNEDLKSKLNRSFSFLETFSSDKIIYGINTGFGPMAQFKIDESKLNQLQYNLIRSHSSGTGNILDDEAARAVMVARINNFLQGNSGISSGVIEKLVAFLNHDIIPEIYEHGGVGASGDLVQLAHLALNLIGEGYVRFNGNRRKTIDVLNELSIAPLELQLRDGLGLMNGTSCMTGISAVNLIYTYRLLDWSIAASSIINEIVEAYDDSFSVGLNSVKLHAGQQFIAEKMRNFLSDSALIKKREELFSDNEVLNHTEFKKKIQEYYSIRCVPQILGPVKETLDYAKSVIENELNSTNDNPIVSVEEQNVFHGGNFHGDYISLEMDKVKIVITKLTMLAERQLNFLLNSRLNDHFPAFLNAQTLGFNFGIQGMQFTATSTTAESQMLSNPMYVHSIPNNNDNQDIVSMGTNSALIAKKVIDNGFQVMAIHMISICQAIDLLDPEKKSKLSTKTLSVYEHIRQVTNMITEDVPQFENIQKVIETLRKTTTKK